MAGLPLKDGRITPSALPTPQVEKHCKSPLTSAVFLQLKKWHLQSLQNYMNNLPWQYYFKGVYMIPALRF